MTNNSSAFYLHAAKHGVEIAIGGGGDYLQSVARGLALGPELVASPAEEGDVACLQSFLLGFVVHKSNHQDFASSGVLYDRGRQSIHFVEVNFYGHPVSPSRAKTKTPLTGVSAGSEILVFEI